jgi:benzoyl-CoA 2,3-epoxidase subunit B
MFVGQTGVGRVIQRTCEVLKEGKDPRAEGVVPPDIIQKYINFWASSSTDLFGSEISSNASNFFRAGLKGRAFESKQTDHLATEGVYDLPIVEGGRMSNQEVPMRNAMNEVLRDAYIADNQKGIDYWNRVIEKFDLDWRVSLPHRAFNRNVGVYAGFHFDPEGNLVDDATWNAKSSEWLPTREDSDYVKSLMKPCLEPGKIANWIAPPAKGINGQSEDYEYVKL